MGVGELAVIDSQGTVKIGSCFSLMAKLPEKTAISAVGADHLLAAV